MAKQIAYALAATVVAAGFCMTPAEAALVLRQSGAVATVGSETAPGSNVYDVVLQLPIFDFGGYANLTDPSRTPGHTYVSDPETRIVNVDAGGHIENIYYFGIVDEYWSDFVDYDASGQYVTSSGGSDYYYDDFYSPVIAYSATDRSFSIEFSAQEKSTVDYSGAFGAGGYEYYQQSYRPLYYDIEYVVDAGPKANYSVTVVSPPVPEPSAWMLMLLGFTGVGVGLRHRRHAPRVDFTLRSLAA